MSLVPFYCKEIYFVVGQIVQIYMSTLWNSHVNKGNKKDDHCSLIFFIMSLWLDKLLVS